MNALFSGAYTTDPTLAYASQLQLSSKRCDNMVGQSVAYPKLWTVGIIRHGDMNLDIVCGTFPLELSSNFDHIFHPAPSMTLHASFYPYERLHGRRESVRHEFEFTVGWDE